MFVYRFHPYFHHFKKYQKLLFNLATPTPAASCQWNPPVLQAPVPRNVARAPCNPSVHHGQRSARPPAPHLALGYEMGTYTPKRAGFWCKEKAMNWVIGVFGQNFLRFSKLWGEICVGKSKEKPKEKNYPGKRPQTVFKGLFMKLMKICDHIKLRGS